MLSRGFKIVAPKRFEVDIEQLDFNSEKALVKIDKGSICKADLRYYLGNRDTRVLGLKYPMRLLHEAVGSILKTSDNSFKIGDRVVLVPNMIVNCDICSNDFCKDEALGENYCPYAQFASSNIDGFSAEIVSHPTSSLVKIPNEVSSDLAVFSELLSVALAALRRIKVQDGQKIAIWGDGIVGYLITVTLKKMFPNNMIIIVGKNINKIEKFPADLKYDLIDESKIKEVKIDIAFECVGGEGSSSAINQIIDCINIGGKIVLTGVAENNVLINTRKILEKGILITGTTRSTKKDFEKALELLKDENFRKLVNQLRLENIEVNNIVDYYNAFEKECGNRKLGRYIINFNI